VDELWWLPIARLVEDRYFYAYNVTGTELCENQQIECIFHMKKYPPIKMLISDLEARQTSLATTTGIDMIWLTSSSIISS
jgi:hypothetical protein